MKLLLIIICVFSFGCSHTSLKTGPKKTDSSNFSETSILRKEWVLNTLSEPYLKTKILQKNPSVLTEDLVVQGDSLYGVRAYDRNTGNLQWFFAVAGGVEGGISASKERLVFGGSDGFFYCLEIKTGLVLWKLYTGSQNLGKPFVSGEEVYFLTSKEKLYALDIRTGKLIWLFRGPQPPSEWTIRGASRPLVDKKHVYAGFSDGSFFALSRKTGKWIWRIKLSDKTHQFKDSDSHPVVRGRLIYVSSFDGGLFCLNKHTGKILWKNKIGAYFGPSIEGKNLYYSSTDGRILALNRFSGKILWTQKVKGAATKPVLYKDTLLYGLSSGPIHLVDKKNGRPVQIVNLFRGVQAEPVIDLARQELYVMSTEAWLYKFKILF